MGNKLFVGGLSWGTSEDALYSTFEQYGQLEEVKIITDRETGRSRGFGFVTFVNEEDAKKAIEGMNETELDGRTLNVNEAKEREPRNNRGGGGGGYGGGGGGGRNSGW